MLLKPEPGIWSKFGVLSPCAAGTEVLTKHFWMVSAQTRPLTHFHLTFFKLIYITLKQTKLLGSVGGWVMNTALRGVMAKVI